VSLPPTPDAGPLRRRLAHTKGGLRLLRLAVVTAFLAIGVHSTIHTLPTVRADVRAWYAGGRPLSQSQRALGAEYSGVMSPAIFDFWRANLRPHDRYYVLVPEVVGSLTGYPVLVDQVAGFALLPAVQVQRPSQADVVVAWGRPLRDAHVPLRRTVRDAPDSASVARTAR
jgi:hypothetical protein